MSDTIQSSVIKRHYYTQHNNENNTALSINDTQNNNTGC
jgi:hypothetical protein